MSYVVIALLLLVITSILAFVLTGNSKLKAKEMKQEIVTGTLGKVVLGAFLGLSITGVFIGISLSIPEKEPYQSESGLDDGSPGKCAHYGGNWENGKCLYDNK